ncbi:hypothetical protein [Novipirellula aureliae]|nr:hypothetical protein [Novipirellula aureliae]
MRSITALIVTLIACTLGCNNVTVDAPFGDSVRTSTLKSFRGTWADKQGNVYFVELGATSDLVVGFTEWNSGSNVFETQSVPISVRTIHNRTFLFIPQDTRKNDKLVFFWLSEIKDGSIFARACNADAFRKAVTSGTLDGTVEVRKNDRFDVHLKSSEMLKKLLASPDGAQLFDEQGDAPLRQLTNQTDGEPSVATETSEARCLGRF